jgi:uncharacterized protein with HEPN domain
MLDAAGKVAAFTQGRKEKDLESDEMLMLAIVRLIEIIGEAAKAVTEETKALAPDVPWKQIGRTRDRLIHGYYNVDLSIVWSIVSKDIPVLISELEKLIPSLEEED